MRYYVVSDVHGFYTPLKTALTEAGFFSDTEPHKLIVCGDMMDRGNEAVDMQNFMVDLHSTNQLIFIRGNHEDLLECMLNDIEDNLWEFVMGSSYHIRNGTWGTALQLANVAEDHAFKHYRDLIFKVKHSPFYKTLIPASVNYFETANYIFVHGWIPCKTNKEMPDWYTRNRNYKFRENWRESAPEEWNTARWFNGMMLAEDYRIVEPNKEIVCGHWHSSFGHYTYGKRGSEFGENADFTPYYGNGVIGIDGCTAHTGKVNCLVIDD